VPRNRPPLRPRRVEEPSRFRYPSQIVVDCLRLLGYAISKTAWFIRYEGLEHLPPNDSPPYILVANHQTYIDPVWICLPLRRRIRYMAFSTAFSWGFVGRLINYLGAFPVPHDGRGTIAAMKTAMNSLRDGAVLVVFPEGGRAFADGKMREFRAGAFRIAQKADVPVIPVTISGGNRIWPQKQKYPQLFRRVVIKYHLPVQTKADSVEEIAATVRRSIRETEAYEG
jgi:1-acyl-sn-glycerol-3-phosphate acyltransferase